jgi:hypothetical protein
VCVCVCVCVCVYSNMANSAAKPLPLPVVFHYPSFIANKSDCRHWDRGVGVAVSLQLRKSVTLCRCSVSNQIRPA